MENRSDGVNSVPYIVYEGAEIRAERRQKRLVIALVVSIVLGLLLTFLSNLLWLRAWMSYDYTSSETLIEAADGMANFHSDNNRCIGDNYNGTNLSEDEGAP